MSEATREGQRDEVCDCVVVDAGCWAGRDVSVERERIGGWDLYIGKNDAQLQNALMPYILITNLFLLFLIRLEPSQVMPLHDTVPLIPCQEAEADPAIAKNPRALLPHASSPCASGAHWYTGTLDDERNQICKCSLTRRGAARTY